MESNLEETLPLSDIVILQFPFLREILDLSASAIQEEALQVQNEFRAERSRHQQKKRKGGAWAHDVRIKNTRNGVSIEWFHYTGRYGDICYSKGIRSEGQLKVPARNFKSCSAVERTAIKTAERRFSNLRQMTRHVTKMAEGMNAIVQMKRLNGFSTDSASDSMLGCGWDCGCEIPCEEFLYFSHARFSI